MATRSARFDIRIVDGLTLPMFLDVFRWRQAGEFFERYGEGVTVLKPAVGREVADINFTAARDAYQLFAVADTEFVEIVAEVHSFLQVYKGGELIGGYADVLRELADGIAGLKERFLFHHVEIEAVKDMIRFAESGFTGSGFLRFAREQG